jgi:hypothetical protein
MLRDVRLGFRLLLKLPSFSVITVLTPALGIGATTAALSLIQGVLPDTATLQTATVARARSTGGAEVGVRSYRQEKTTERRTPAGR